MLYMSNFTTHNVEVRYTCSVVDCDANFTQVTNRTEVNDTLPYEYVCVLKPQPEDFVSSCFFQVCVYAMYGIIFIVALLGNGLVCFVVHSSPRMKTVTNYFIMNLAVGDIMMTLFCVPFSFVSMLLLRYWPFGGVMCKVVNYSQAVSVLVSAYTLLAISIDRYFVITRPLKPRLSKMAAKLVMGAVWSGALATAAPILVVSQLQKPSLWHQVCELDICSERWANAEQSAQYTWALLVLQFALPLCALICTYGRIAYVVWAVQPPGEAETIRDSRIQHSKRKTLPKRSEEGHQENIIFSCHAHDSEKQVEIYRGTRKKWRSSRPQTFWSTRPIFGPQYIKVPSHGIKGFLDKRMVKMMITVVAVFTICWLPLNIFIMLWTAHEDDEEWGKWPGLPYVWFVSHWLAMSHCCCNPIIYCYMNVRYRSGFKQVLGKILCLNNDDGSRSHHRSSVCEGVPLSEMMGVDGSMRQRSLTRCRCTFSNTDGSRKCTSTCFSVRQHKSASRTVPPRAASVRSHFD